MTGTGPAPESPSGNDALQRFVVHDAAMSALGVTVLEVAPGRAVTAMAVGPEHADHRGYVATGLVFTLADTAIALASNAYGPVALLGHADAEWRTAVRPGCRLTATCDVVTRTGDGAATFTSVVTDEVGTVVGAVWGSTKTPRQGPSA